MLHRYPAHSEAVARITWCAHERALGVITGEVGSGKTAAARAAVTALDQTRHTLIYLPDPTTGTRGIHHHIVTALGGRPAYGSAVLAAQAAALIAAEHGERGRLPLLVVDEAHLLGHAQLEAIRLLTNAEMDAASPLACLLIGQPTLRRMLRLGVLAALDQRIGLRYAMPAMTPAQTSDYITHHLKLAGRSDTLFSDDAMALVHDAARGLPGPSTTSPPRRSSPRWPTARTSSTSSPPAPRSARSRQTDHHRATRTPRPRRLTPTGPYSHPHMLTADDAFILILNDRAHLLGRVFDEAIRCKQEWQHAVKQPVTGVCLEDVRLVGDHAGKVWDPSLAQYGRADTKSTCPGLKR